MTTRLDTVEACVTIKIRSDQLPRSPPRDHERRRILQNHKREKENIHVSMSVSVVFVMSRPTPAVVACPPSGLKDLHACVFACPSALLTWA